MDESGDPGYGEGGSSHLVVAVVVVGHPERLRKAVTRTRKSMGKPLKDIPELKAEKVRPDPS